ncbi:hypothetical protein AB1Y20_014244 [Prymnesium parvum]|uniref:Exostosin GT47 domain-containing protein n=1 Tax=Prymnesium parvum TaxID=97485 RepID=A0AB34IFN8_PRYPA
MLPPLARLRLLPARACGRLGCGGLGWCGQLPHEPSPRCRCAARLAHEAPPAAAAAACATRGPELWRHSAGGARRSRCPNGCGGAGRCVLGFCHCAAGAWGLDCGMSAARAAALLRGGARPKVFVYELPPALRRSCNAWRLPEDVADRLLRSEHLSPTPAAADYFWYYGCPNGDMVLPALRWIWRTYPMWNDSVRRGTPRHVMVVAHEEGWAEVWRYLVEWLRHTPGGDHANSGGRWDAIHPASASRQLAVLQLSGNSDYTPPGVARRQRCVSAGARCYLCFQPGKDVVVPAAPGLVDYPDEQMCARFAARQERRDAWGGALQRTGDRVFFSGAIWTKPRGNGFYEASRLVPYRCHRHAREARVHLRQTETALEAVQPSEVEPPVDSVGFAARAEMCVVPEGKAGSYGHRALAAVQLGCVPLFTKERFSFDFFHEAINWTEAAVFVPPVEMPRLLQMLPSGEELLRMRRAGARLRRRLLWTSIYGDCHLPRGDGHEPDAFDTLMQVLRQPRRYFKLSSVHYAPRAPELLKDLDPWLEAHGGASLDDAAHKAEGSSLRASAVRMHTQKACIS